MRHRTQLLSLGFLLVGCANLSLGGTVVGWGDDSVGQLDNMPSGTFTEIAASRYGGYGIRTDGTIAVWGDDSVGQLDNMPSGTFTEIAASRYGGYGIRTDGTIAGWGDDSVGQLDNIPSGTFSSVVAGDYHGYGITAVAPTADAGGPYIVNAGDPLVLDSSGSTDVDNDIVSYVWDLDGDGCFETDASGQPVYSVSYSDLLAIGLHLGGTYAVQVKVSDAIGLNSIDDTTLTIVPEPATLSLLALGGLALIRRKHA